MQLLFCDTATGRPLAQPQHDRLWHRTTAKVGWHAVGLWRAGDDGSDINAVSVSLDTPPLPGATRGSFGAQAAANSTAATPAAEVCEVQIPAPAAGSLGRWSLIAAADDDGLIRLARAPCVYSTASMQRHAGHASHVACVRFCSGGRRVVSTGADGCVMQWRVVPVSAATRLSSPDAMLHNDATRHAAAAVRPRFTGPSSIDELRDSRHTRFAAFSGDGRLASLGYTRQGVQSNPSSAAAVEGAALRLQAELDVELSRLARGRRCDSFVLACHVLCLTRLPALCSASAGVTSS